MQDIRNIVIFGPAGSGKSTLTGYLYNYAMGTKFDLKKFNENIKNKLGANYDSSCKFAYISDRYNEERIRDRERPDPETGSTKTKLMHAFEINLEGFENVLYVLDTPAASDRTKTRPREYIKGISFADIGIFMIDIGTVKDFQTNLTEPSNQKDLQEALTPLSIWLNFRDKDKLIVLISKMDDVNFLQEEFENAVTYIESISEPISGIALPVFIDVNKEVDYNILNKHDNLSWFKGQTLIEILKDMDEKIKLPRSDNKQLFISVYKEQSSAAIGKTFRGKVIQGTLNTSSKIKISPIKYLNSELSDVYADISEIYNLDLEPVNSATPGDIVSISLKNINTDRKYLDIDEIFYETSTCIYDANMSTKRVEVLQFEVEKVPNTEQISKNFDLQSIAPSRDITLIWFGKTVPCKVKNITIKDHKILLTIGVMNKLSVSVPLNDKNDYIFKDYLFEVDKTTYFEAHLIGIGN